MRSLNGRIFPADVGVYRHKCLFAIVGARLCELRVDDHTQRAGSGPANAAESVDATQPRSVYQFVLRHVYKHDAIHDTL